MRIPNAYVRYDSKPGIVMIELSKGKFAEIDEADLGLVMPYRWHADKSRNTYYAVTNVRKPAGKQTTLKLHRLLMNPGKFQVDHGDGNGLNNTRGNLRLCSNKENQGNQRLRSTNTSGFKGVTWYKRYENWLAYIRINGVKKHLGYFTTARAAALAYDAAAIEAFGDFACTNKMMELL